MIAANEGSRSFGRQRVSLVDKVETLHASVSLRQVRVLLVPGIGRPVDIG